jgi:hypothetical protein
MLVCCIISLDCVSDVGHEIIQCVGSIKSWDNTLLFPSIQDNFDIYQVVHALKASIFSYLF